MGIRSSLLLRTWSHDFVHVWVNFVPVLSFVYRNYEESYCISVNGPYEPTHFQCNGQILICFSFVECIWLIWVLSTLLIYILFHNANSFNTDCMYRSDTHFYFVYLLLFRKAFCVQIFSEYIHSTLHWFILTLGAL